MAQKKINYSFANDGLGDPLRQAFVKSDDNFDELYTNKVDKVTGKSLTDVNFSAIDKAKLDSIDASASSQSDFAINDPLSPSFIRNKPTLLSQFDNNLDFVEDVTTAGVFGRSAGEWAEIDVSSKENTANKQNSLTPDGTGNKYPTIDIINSGLSKKIKIVIEGDSRSALPSPTPIFWDTYFKQNSTLGKEAKIINVASGGDTIENMILTFNSQVLPHAPVNGELAYFILYAGANDLGPGLGHTGSVVYEDWKTLVTLAKNAGFIVVAGCDAGAAIGWTIGQRNQCNIFNDLIRSDKSYYSFLLEPDLVLPASDVSNYSDGIHFTNLGSERFAKHVAQKLSEIESSNLPLEISRFNNMLVDNNTTSNNTVSKGGLTSFSSENGGIYNYYSGGGVVASFSDNAGTFSQLNLEALNFVFKANGVSKLYLNQLGNLGLGISNPVNNTGYAGFSLNGASGSIQSFMQNGVETFRIGNYEGYSFIDTTGNTPLLFGTNSNEAFRISESGNTVFLNTPTAPTATAGTNTTQIATTAFVSQNTVTLTGNQTVAGRKSIVSSNATLSGLTLTNTRTTNTGGTSDSAIIEITNSGTAGISVNSTAGTAITASNDAGVVYQAGKTGAAVGLNINDYDASGTGDVISYSKLGSGQLFRVLASGQTIGQNATALNHLITKAQTLYTNQTITANKTVTISEFANNNELILSVNATSGNIAITLPTFTALQGYKLTVKKMDSSANSVLIQGVGGVNIDGSASVIISGQYSSSTIGANLQQYIIL